MTTYSSDYIQRCRIGGNIGGDLTITGNPRLDTLGTLPATLEYIAGTASVQFNGNLPHREIDLLVSKVVE